MITVWKYELEITDYQVIEMPYGAKPLRAEMIGDDLMLWALVNPKAALVEHAFVIVGTGHIHRLPLGEYVSTAIQRNGALIWHVFYKGMK